MVEPRALSPGACQSREPGPFSSYRGPRGRFDGLDIPNFAPTDRGENRFRHGFPDVEIVFAYMLFFAYVGQKGADGGDPHCIQYAMEMREFRHGHPLDRAEYSLFYTERPCRPLPFAPRVGGAYAPEENVVL